MLGEEEIKRYMFRLSEKGIVKFVDGSTVSLTDWYLDLLYAIAKSVCREPNIKEVVCSSDMGVAEAVEFLLQVSIGCTIKLIFGDINDEELNHMVSIIYTIIRLSQKRAN